MKKELFSFAFLSVFITLIDLGAQIPGAQTRYTVVNFGLDQPLSTVFRHPKPSELLLISDTNIFENICILQYISKLHQTRRFQ